LARKINLSQIKSKINQAKNKRKAALRKIENDVNRAINKYNQGVRQYNQKAKQHNTNVRASRQKLNNALNIFKSRTYRPTATIQYSVELNQSAQTLNRSYERLESGIVQRHDAFDRRLLLDLPEQENTNNLMLYNSLAGNDEDDGQSVQDLGRTAIEELIYQTSPEYCKRWQGAIFALNPDNPDAARHFCTSAREICVGLLDIHAPNEEVLVFNNNDLTEDGRPTRRSKIKFLLNRKSILDSNFESFVDQDMKNVLQLFHVLNGATHGSAGKFGVPQLLKLKKRVEDSIMFINSIAV